MVSQLNNSRPFLSICIANYNGMEVIDTCLQSVGSQQCSFEFEVLVHDDCSTDDSTARIAQAYPEVNLIRSESNCGFCRSNNRMVAAARGEYLLLLNNDTRLHDGALEALYQYATQHPHAGVLTLPQYNMDDGKLLDKGMYLDPFANPIPNLDPGSRRVATVMGSCLWISRELWLELGGLPEWFGSMAEDMYLCTRARLLGRDVCVVDASGYDHEVGHSFGGGKVKSNILATSYKRRSLSELNKNRVIALCFPAPTHLLILLVQAMLLLTEGLVLSLLKMTARPLREIYLPSLLTLLREHRDMRQLRRQIQASRRISLAEFFVPIHLTHHKLVLLFRHGMPRIA